MTFSMLMWAFSFFCFGASIALWAASRLYSYEREVDKDFREVNSLLHGYVVRLSGEVAKRDKALIIACKSLEEKTGMPGKCLYHKLMEDEA